MLGVSPVKVGEVCHVEPPLMLYSQPVMVLRVMLVAVATSKVGASGAVCGALVTTMLK